MTLRALVNDADEVVLRCSVCRRRDWRAGRDGRGTKVGSIMLEAGALVVFQAPRRALGAALDRSVPRNRPVNTRLGGLDEAAEARWRCRVGHRLRFDVGDVRRQLARRTKDVWLPPA